MRPAHTTTGGLILAASLMLAGPAAATHPGDRDCPEFDSQAAAQAHYREHPGDPDGLDRNNNKVACENHPDYSDPTRDEEPLEEEASVDTSPEESEDDDDITMPSGGVATGAGGTAGDDVSTGLIVAGGLALTAAGGGLVLSRRRSVNN